jgi:hypothetical protein
LLRVFKKKAELQAGLEAEFIRYQAFVLEHGERIPDLSFDTPIPVSDDWEAEDDAEMDDESQ